MTVAEVDIASIALSYVGSGPIQSFTEKTNEAAVCNLHYRFALAETLQAFPWPDIKARVALTALDEALIPRLWTYAYALPADCIRPRFLVGADALPDPRFRQKFEIYADPGTGQKYLVTNLEDPHLIYSTSAMTVDKFSPMLIDAIAWKLAVKIALPITRTAARLDDAMAGWTRALSAAETLAANEDPDTIAEWTPDWIAERNGSTFGVDNG